MDEKRRISLERASKLHEEIEDYLAFKDDFLRETAEIRDVLSKKHKEELMDYFEENNYPYVIFNNCNYKDANLALTQDRNKFEQEISTICDDIIQKEKRKQKLHNAEM